MNQEHRNQCGIGSDYEQSEVVDGLEIRSGYCVCHDGEYSVWCQCKYDFHQLHDPVVDGYDSGPALLPGLSIALDPADQAHSHVYREEYYCNRCCCTFSCKTKEWSCRKQ